MRRAGKSQRGETLIEAMMALVVFAIGILGVFQMNILASEQNGLAQHETTAAQIARSLVDDLEAVPFNHPALDTLGADLSDADFADAINSTNHCHRLGDATNDDATHQPLLGSAMQIWAAANRGGVNAYDVCWKVADQTDARGVVQSHTVAVMVVFTSAGGGKKQVTLWTVLYSPAAVRSSAGGLELGV